MNEMIKRKKDEGFTLIELMIVIAVIGILAVVLVPKFGNIKTSAKNAGVATNFRSVTASVHAIKFAAGQDTESEVNFEVHKQLNKDFPNGTNNVLVNPYTKFTFIIRDDSGTGTSSAQSAVVTTLTAGKPVPDTSPENNYVGKIVVMSAVVGGLPTVTVYGCDDTGKLIDGLKEVIQP